jgi:hypothetical protein
MTILSPISCMRLCSVLPICVDEARHGSIAYTMQVRAPALGTVFEALRRREGTMGVTQHPLDSCDDNKCIISILWAWRVEHAPDSHRLSRWALAIVFQ